MVTAAAPRVLLKEENGFREQPQHTQENVPPGHRWYESGIAPRRHLVRSR